MLRITQPGFYPDMSADDYHADCCPDPSLTQSVAKVLLDRSPLHAWASHPRLNPAFERHDPSRFDLANVAHKLLLGRGKDVVVIDAPDWRSKAAKEERDAALGAGRLPVLPEQHGRALLMVDAALDAISNSGLVLMMPGDDRIVGGSPEMVIAWRDDVAGWCRAMIDWLSDDRRLVLDYKTTAASAAPHAIGQKMAADGWCIQAAMHEAGLDVLDPENAGRRRHIFVCQETTAPYAVTLAQIGEGPMTMGRKQLAAARSMWASCMETKVWPGYPDDVIMPEYPGWAENRWLEREVGEFGEVRAARPMRRDEPMLSDLAGG